MKVVLQRCREANVKVNGKIVGAIDMGFILYVGFTHGDTQLDCDWMAEKVAHLRVFEDETGKMNRSIIEEQGGILSISQFTLYGDCKKGRRPNFMEAAHPDVAEKLYDYFNDALSAKGLKVETGEFGKMMDVASINEGPVTIILERP